MPRLLFATHNRAKAREMAAILATDAPDLSIEPVSLADLGNVVMPPEGTLDFRSNAVAKAQAASRQSSMLAIADDSGLEVPYLGGLPGTLSARFAGERASDQENNQKLLGMLRGVPMNLRKAVFRCAVAIALPSGWVQVVQGACEGYIAFEPAGREGFGYDPLFFYPPAGKTFGQMTREQKDAVSHRGDAVRKAGQVLRRLLEIS